MLLRGPCSTHRQPQAEPDACSTCRTPHPNVVSPRCRTYGTPSRRQGLTRAGLARRGHRRDSDGRFWHPGGVFEHFTDGARRILVLAYGEAQGLHVSSIGPEHLFLGMLREPEGIAGNALSDAGADYNRARAVLEEHEREQTGPWPDREPFSEATIKVMERSLQISWARADAGIGTEHLLVALLEQDNDATEAVLAGLDITPEEVMQRAEALLAERSL